MTKVILWILLAAAAEAFEVLEPSEPLNVRDDEALELTCTGSDPWLYCKWSFFDKDCARDVGLILDIIHHRLVIG